MMRRLLSLILTASLLLSMVPAEALAQTIDWSDPEPLMQAWEEPVQAPQPKGMGSSEFEAKLSGRVLDPEGNPLPGVSVSIYDLAEEIYEKDF